MKNLKYFQEFIKLNESNSFSESDLYEIADYIEKNLIGDNIKSYKKSESPNGWMEGNKFKKIGMSIQWTNKNVMSKEGSIYTISYEDNYKSINLQLSDSYSTSVFQPKGRPNNPSNIATAKDYGKTKHSKSINKSFEDGNIQKIFKAIDAYKKKEI